MCLWDYVEDRNVIVLFDSLGNPIVGVCVVISRFALSLCVLIFATSSIWAQCNHEGSCVQGICPQPLGSCGNNNDWKDNFFNCCKAKQFDGPICDPCCSRPYFSFAGGYNNLNAINNTTSFSDATIIDIINPGSPPTFDDFLAETTEVSTVRERGFLFDAGYAFNSAIGYRVHRVVRVEAELGFRENDVTAYYTEDSVTTTRTIFDNPNFTNGSVLDTNTIRSRTEDPATGAVRSYSSMFNAYYDFSAPRLRCCNLYLAGGLGMSYLDGEMSTATTDYSVSSTSFAYQLIFGGNLPITQKLDLFADYRFLGMSRMSIDDVTSNISLGQTEPIANHSVFFGVRCRLGR